MYLNTWLTLTWDVLKYKFNEDFNAGLIGLTLTWDVLKCFLASATCIASAININMRCIEIHLIKLAGDERIEININMRCIEIQEYIAW